jgi:hypothetical protein
MVPKQPSLHAGSPNGSSRVWVCICACVYSGSNFGNANNINYVMPVVAIGSSACTIVPPHTDSRIVCTVGSGSGKLQPVTIAVVQQVTSGLFFYSYDAPKLYTISPPHGASQGGYPVTLTGEML